MEPGYLDGLQAYCNVFSCSAEMYQGSIMDHHYSNFRPFNALQYAKYAIRDSTSRKERTILLIYEFYLFNDAQHT